MSVRASIGRVSRNHQKLLIYYWHVDTINQKVRLKSDSFFFYSANFGDSECDARTVSYSQNLKLIQNQRLNHLSPSQIKQKCILSNNGDNCAAKACASEFLFSKKFYELLIERGAPVSKYKHKSHGGKFEPEIECRNMNENRMITEKIDSEIECCGVYAQRFPFRNLNGINACCGVSSYNSLVMQCCEGDVLRASCD